jgi:hypothetical protein
VAQRYVLQLQDQWEAGRLTISTRVHPDRDSTDSEYLFAKRTDVLGGCRHDNNQNQVR